MKTNSKINKLKKEARKNYFACCEIVDSSDCGFHLLGYMSHDLEYYKTEFNRIMDKLAELDPTTPPARL